MKCIIVFFNSIVKSKSYLHDIFKLRIFIGLITNQQQYFAYFVVLKYINYFVMKYLYTILFNVLIFTSLYSQNINNLQDNDTTALFQKKVYPALNKYDNKLQFHFQTGASVSSFGNNTLFSKWIAPSFSYKVNPKLNLHFGTFVLNENANYPSLNSEMHNAAKTDPTRVFLNLSGDYRLTKSIRLRATTFNELPNGDTPQNYFYYNQLGIDIKVTDNFFISADFINQKGRTSHGMYNNSMFFNSDDYFGNSFFNNIFINTFH